MTLFVDSDGFVALSKEDDTNHDKAIKILQKAINIGVLFVTSNYVFSEVVTVLSQRSGHEAALRFIRRMKSPASGYNFEWIDENVEKEAINIFSQQTSKNVSFVDCTNMAVMKIKRIDAVFSFDDVYRKNGFSVFDADVFSSKAI